jgi:hypothetical protein
MTFDLSTAHQMPVLIRCQYVLALLSTFLLAYAIGRCLGIIVRRHWYHAKDIHGPHSFLFKVSIILTLIAIALAVINTLAYHCGILSWPNVLDINVNAANCYTINMSAIIELKSILWSTVLAFSSSGLLMIASLYIHSSFQGYDNPNRSNGT